MLLWDGWVDGWMDGWMGGDEIPRSVQEMKICIPALLKQYHDYTATYHHHHQQHSFHHSC